MENGQNGRVSIWALIAALSLFVLLYAVSYPYYQYSIDPDSSSYLAIAKRYAAGDYSRAINGLWSPFQPWLVAICLKLGMKQLFAAHLTSAIACIGILIAAYCLFSKFMLNRLITISLMFAMSIYLVYYQYLQVFDDLWQIFFLLCYLLLILSNNFLVSPWKWLLCGVLAALAYYAKAYSFYFVVLHLIASLLILSRHAGKSFAKTPLVTIYAVTLILMSPWLYALHQKYGKWMLSSAGSLNTSWTLTGHKTYKPGIKYLIPPPYDNSPSNMEDPYLNEGHLYKVTDGPGMLLMQIVRSTYAFFQGIVVVNEISCLILGVLVVSVFLMFSGKDEEVITPQHKILLWAAIIMPLGYLTIHFESRYIWLLGYIGMIMGGSWLMVLGQLRGYEKTARYLTIVFAISFIAYPVYDMKNMLRKNEQVYKDAMQMKHLGIKGSFTSNGNPSQAGITAIFTDMPYYTLDQYNISPVALLGDMRRYKVNYYLYYCKPSDSSSIVLKDERGIPFPEVTDNSIPGLKIFHINP